MKMIISLSLLLNLLSTSIREIFDNIQWNYDTYLIIATAVSAAISLILSVKSGAAFWTRVAYFIGGLAIIGVGYFNYMKDKEDKKQRAIDKGNDQVTIISLTKEKNELLAKQEELNEQLQAVIEETLADNENYTTVKDDSVDSIAFRITLINKMGMTHFNQQLFGKLFSKYPKAQVRFRFTTPKGEAVYQYKWANMMSSCFVRVSTMEQQNPFYEINFSPDQLNQSANALEFTYHISKRDDTIGKYHLKGGELFKMFVSEQDLFGMDILNVPPDELDAVLEDVKSRWPSVQVFAGLDNEPDKILVVNLSPEAYTVGEERGIAITWKAVGKPAIVQSVEDTDDSGCYD